MVNYCAFIKNHKCFKWENYEFTRHELWRKPMLCITATGSRYSGCEDTSINSERYLIRMKLIIWKADQTH